MMITIEKSDGTAFGPAGYRAVTHDRGGRKVAGEAETLPGALRELASFIEATSFDTEPKEVPTDRITNPPSDDPAPFHLRAVASDLRTRADGLDRTADRLAGKFGREEG